MQSWPEDVIHIIVFVLAQDSREIQGLDAVGRRTISAIASCCRTLRSIAQPVLYETVSVKTFPQAEKLHELLRMNPNLVSSTKTLIMGDSSLESSSGIKASDHINGYLNQPKLGPELFAHFTALFFLRISRICLGLLSIQKCFPRINHIRELRVDRCIFDRRSLLTALLEILPDLETFMLDCDFAEEADLEVQTPLMPAFQNPTHDPITAVVENTPQSLRSLSIRRIAGPNPNHTDSILPACEELVRSRRVSSLVDLSFDLSERSRVTAMGYLVRHTAQTLTSLTVRCPIYGPQTPAPNFGPLPRLRSLHLINITNLCYEDAAELLIALLYETEGELKLNLQIQAWGELLTESAAPIWAAVDTMAHRARISVGIEQTLWKGIHPLNEAEIRGITPLASAREDFLVTITHTEIS